MLDTKLIEKALALTDTKISKMQNTHNEYEFFFEPRFFFAYLLSPEFIEKYYPIAKAYLEQKYFPIDSDTEEENKESYMDDIAWAIWKEIRKYQLWNEKPLIELLSKI